MQIITIDGADYALIAMTKGHSTIVDIDMWEDLSRFKWSLSSGYAVRGEKHRTIAMHRVVAQTPNGLHTDHINGNKLDNRRSNLRHATRSENQRNRHRASKHNKLGVKGVSRYRDKFLACIRLNGKTIYIGVFTTILEAQAAYNAAAIRLHGEFARLSI